MRRGNTHKGAGGLGQGKIGMLSSPVRYDGEKGEIDGGWGGSGPRFCCNHPPGEPWGWVMYGRGNEEERSMGNTTELAPDWNKGLQRKQGQKGSTLRCEILLFCATSGREQTQQYGGRHSCKHKWSREAIQANLPEDGGREGGEGGRGRREEKEQIYEGRRKRRVEGGVLHAQRVWQR